MEVCLAFAFAPLVVAHRQKRSLEGCKGILPGLQVEACIFATKTPGGGYFSNPVFGDVLVHGRGDRPRDE